VAGTNTGGTTATATGSYPAALAPIVMLMNTVKKPNQGQIAAFEDALNAAMEQVQAELRFEDEAFEEYRAIIKAARERDRAIYKAARERNESQDKEAMERIAKREQSKKAKLADFYDMKQSLCVAMFNAATPSKEQHISCNRNHFQGQIAAFEDALNASMEQVQAELRFEDEAFEEYRAIIKAARERDRAIYKAARERNDSQYKEAMERIAKREQSKKAKLANFYDMKQSLCVAMFNAVTPSKEEHNSCNRNHFGETPPSTTTATSYHSFPPAFSIGVGDSDKKRPAKYRQDETKYSHSHKGSSH
jgi:hypothetical protein